MRPNLFILGAGKCGTTSLYRLLERHPDVHVSVPKEPSFFCSQFQVVKNPVDYFRLFDSPRRYRVDASHVYFSNPETAPILRDLFPDAKFVIILRQPKARALSLYQHMRRFSHEDGDPFEPAETFLEALRLEAGRFQSPAFFATCRQYFWNFMYMRSSAYDEQLGRYLALYPPDRFLVTTLAALERQPQHTVRSLADFLGIDASGLGQDIPLENAAPVYEACDPESDALMDAFFGDLCDRVDRLIGHPLDWSR